MEKMFQQALSDSSVEQSICKILCTDFPFYYSSLKSQNVLSFIYLRNMTNYLIKTNTSAVQYIASHHEQLLGLIYSSTEQNFAILLTFFEALSLSGHLWPSFYRDVALRIQTDFARSVKVYASVFRRYEVLKGSSQLHMEISDNIDLLKEPLFAHMLDHGHVAANVDDLLTIFYYLIYQDIHPFFENNMDKFCVYFDSIFGTHFNSLYKIFSLCIAKYSDCVDIYKILELCVAKKDTDAIIVQILKKREFGKLRSYYGDIAAYVLRKRNSAEELLDDPLRLTRKAVLGRKDEILAILDNEDFKHVLLSKFPASFHAFVGLRDGHVYERYPPHTRDLLLELERLVEICMSLRIPISVQQLLHCEGTPEGQLLFFRVVEYLLATPQDVDLSPALAETHPHCAYIVMHYLTVKHFRVKKENVDLALKYMRDEYSTRLIFMSVRHSVQNTFPLGENALGIRRALDELGGKDSHKSLKPPAEINTEKIAEEIVKYLYSTKEVGNVVPYFYLFDALGLLASHANYVLLLRLTNHILMSGTEELFHLCFYLLALLAKFNFDATGLVETITKRRDLWEEDALVFPLCCLTASLADRIEKTFVHDLISHLLQAKKSAAYFLIAKTGHPVPEIADVEEELFVKVHRGIAVDLDYFRKNYVSARNTRKAVKALCMLGLSNDEIVRKNLANYKDDANVPFFICEQFGM
jgi:hypothetical protein